MKNGSMMPNKGFNGMLSRAMAGRMMAAKPCPPVLTISKDGVRKVGRWRISKIPAQMR